MLSSRFGQFGVKAGKSMRRCGQDRFLSPQIASSLSMYDTVLTSTAFQNATFRFFSKRDNDSSQDIEKLPPHKQIVPPMPPPPNAAKPSMIVEPPVRTRPYRQFRGSSGKKLSPIHHKRAPAQAGPSSPRRIAVQTPGTSEGQFGSYPVQAVQLAQSIDLPAVISKVFATKGVRRMMERLSVVVQLPPKGGGDGSARFVAVFRFGSVVFFNVEPREASNLLWQIKKSAATDPVLSGNELKENFCVHVQPEIPEDGRIVTGDYCVVQELNMKSVDVISNIMAQSVALDSYNDTVDELLTRFETINGTVTGSGDVGKIDKDLMFRAVARNNSIFIEMVSRVGIKDRIDTAWNLSQYEDIHDGMKEEFDIDRRFEHIEFKLNLIQENAKFFLEVLSHQKSDTLEWIIIVLILFECILMIMEMSGTGEAFFAFFKDVAPSLDTPTKGED